MSRKVLPNADSRRCKHAVKREKKHTAIEYYAVDIFVGSVIGIIIGYAIITLVIIIIKLI
ncbi:hypothetical protein SDC9_75565 [bioreactor metagenome]|uniref:Uncharacterized protein n=1 Tax=bioreactor metagenome TaxID=1076179 RepID=A0A644YL39_9ZZZZ